MQRRRFQAALIFIASQIADVNKSSLPAISDSYGLYGRWLFAYFGGWFLEFPGPKECAFSFQ
jgi:hypothetical protein